ncbi:hypothetical protein BBK36DRAFT_1169956 [Trichoderma citrinoviride]|uniref:C2H2-type domain-containing protein n=1 Tax=Trichoderma citrinoviride TaxID=58853 RepID=A0A2T4B796_9HYPO|nr:hypothetical protein BBK36DRAFT_1169956 [Trichoderma citrinoviride]PTB65203.1 hypothetical protein BBK36DRAFT_1169956 [Trichoderma citrinoviride]
MSEGSTEIRCHCGRSFKDAEAIAQHRRDTKPHPPKNRYSLFPIDKLMRCSCGRGFKSEKALLQHKSMSPRHPRKASVAQADTKNSSSPGNMKDGDDRNKLPTETGGATSDAFNLARDKEYEDDDTASKDEQGSQPSQHTNLSDQADITHGALSSSFTWYPGVGDNHSLCYDRCGWCGHCAGGTSRFATVFELSLRLKLQGDNSMPPTGRYPFLQIQVHGGVIESVGETSI